MNFNIVLKVTEMLDKYETSKPVRCLINTLVFILFVFVLGTFITAIRWW